MAFYEPTQNQPIIAIIDDEAIVTRSIKSFLELETDYWVETFQSPVEALQSFETKPPDFIISDFLMPQMNGLEFLNRAKSMYPDVPRVMLTAYADKENAIKAINEVGLFQYIQKPWDNDSLKLVIKNGLANKKLNFVLEQKVHEIDLIVRQKDELIEAQDIMQQELLLAKQVHSKFLLPEKIECNGISLYIKYRPSFEIGGDYYDVIPLAHNKLAILIADLTGHGIQAALCTALLKFAFTAFRDTDKSAQKIMSGMNETLYKGLPKDSFAAAMLVIIDTKTFECTLLNGGIPYPFILKRSKKKVKKLFSIGMILGMFSDDIYIEEEPITFQLSEKDTLFLFTDGLTEIRQKNGVFMGEQLLLDIVKDAVEYPTPQILEKLLTNAISLNDSNYRLDDITILGIELSRVGGRKSDS